MRNTEAAGAPALADEGEEWRHHRAQENLRAQRQRGARQGVVEGGAVEGGDRNQASLDPGRGVIRYRR